MDCPRHVAAGCQKPCLVSWCLLVQDLQGATRLRVLWQFFGITPWGSWLILGFTSSRKRETEKALYPVAASHFSSGIALGEAVSATMPEHGGLAPCIITSPVLPGKTGLGALLEAPVCSGFQQEMEDATIPHSALASLLCVSWVLIFQSSTVFF